MGATHTWPSFPLASPSPHTGAPRPRSSGEAAAARRGRGWPQQWRPRARARARQRARLLREPPARARGASGAPTAAARGRPNTGAAGAPSAGRGGREPLLGRSRLATHRLWGTSSPPNRDCRLGRAATPRRPHANPHEGRPFSRTRNQR